MIESKVENIAKEYGKTAKIAVLEILTLERSLRTDKPTRYIPVPEWKKYHDYPTESAIRNYINKADKNGFNEVMTRKGRRILLDENKMFEWLGVE